VAAPLSSRIGALPALPALCSYDRAPARQPCEIRCPGVGRAPPTFISRQAAIRVDLALERGQECCTRPRRQAPGIVRGMQEMGADAAA